MARNIKDLHPRLQELIKKLQKECEKKGITIGIGECLRSVKEQNDLYAKGRTKPGIVVTNCTGSDYSSPHQWGIAFDFYLIEDVDGDGKTSDDAFNNKTKLFNQVGAIGRKIGLEWGGDWRGWVDLPHFQLPDWGSTTSTLKRKYKTPDKFMATWKKEEEKAAKKKEAEAKKEEKKKQTEAKIEEKKATKYYKKYTGKSTEVDKVFKAIDVPAKYIGSVEKRKPVAKKNSISSYKGTEKQNTKLVNLAKKGKLKKA